MIKKTLISGHYIKFIHGWSSIPLDFMFNIQFQLSMSLELYEGFQESIPTDWKGKNGILGIYLLFWRFSLNHNLKNCQINRPQP